MPIYEYDCPKCGDFEVTQRITDDPLKRCPTCRGKVKKLISNTSFQLKGSGWYQTDYGSKKREDKGDSKEKTEGGSDKSAAAEQSTSTESAAGKTESTGTEKKPAKKGKRDTTAKAA